MTSNVIPLGDVPPLKDRLAAHTLPFLAALLACTPKEVWKASLTFQVFDDDEVRKDPKRARTLHGSLSALAQELERRNRAGAGIFVVLYGLSIVGTFAWHRGGWRTRAEA